MNGQQHSGPHPTRRALLRTGLAATAAGTLGAFEISRVSAHRPDYGSPLYNAALSATGGVKGLFQSPAIDATMVTEKDVNHLLLLQLKNWLNSLEQSYRMDPKDLHTIVATYASANVLTYGDKVWETYRLGEKYGIVDPVTGKPAVRNVFWPSRFGMDALKDPATKNNLYLDTGIEALQLRGAVFLTCLNSLMGHAAAAIADGGAPSGMTQGDVVDDIRAHLIPNATLVPAVVAEVSLAQQVGYTLVFIPNFKL